MGSPNSVTNMSHLFQALQRMEAFFLKYRYFAYAILVLAFIIVRVSLVQAPINSDDVEYFQNANDLAHGTDILKFEGLSKTTGPIYGRFRIGMIMPVCLFIKTFGDNIISYYIYPFLFSVLGFFLIIQISKTIFPTIVVFMVAIAHMVYPLEISHSSLLLVDMPAAALTLLYIYYTYKHPLEKRNWKKLLIYSFTGSIILLWIYLVRTNHIVLLMPCFICFVCYRKYRSTVVMGMMFLIIWILIEQLVYMSKGMPFGYIWRATTIVFANLAYTLPKYSIPDFLLRGFVQMYDEFGLIVLLYYVLSIVFHLYGIMFSRNVLIRALLISGFVIYLAFTFNVYDISDGMIRSLALMHRYVQLFYYSSLIAFAYGINSLVMYLQKKISNLKTVRLTRLSKYGLNCATLMLFLCLLIVFSEKSYNMETRLLGNSSEYSRLISALNAEMNKVATNRIRVVGCYTNLRVMKLFPRISTANSVDWNDLSYDDLLITVRGKLSEYVFKDISREDNDKLFTIGEYGEHIGKTINDISLELIDNYHPIYQTSNFVLYKKGSSLREIPIVFPNMNLADFNVQRQQISFWSGGINEMTRLSESHGRLNIKCSLPDGAIYIVSNDAPFESPPSNKKEYSLDSNTTYMFQLDISKTNGLEVQFWLMEYDQEKRIKSSDQVLKNSINMFSFCSGNKSQYFRIAFRLSGVGSITFNDFQMYEISHI